jgi:hypothetical protein
MMHVQQTRPFDAYLPGVSTAVRIATLHDAQVFARRWAIRDKDLALKALVRCLERANSSTSAENAVRELKRALESRGLLPRAMRSFP